MMALRMLSVALAYGSCGVAMSSPTFHPFEVTYATLESSKMTSAKGMQELETALGVNGVLSITNIPDFAELRHQALLEAHACILKSPNAHSHTFADGTTRHTLAASSNHLLGQQHVDHGSNSPECEAWDTTAAKFRSLVAKTADLFGHHLDKLFGLNGSSVLLDSSDGETYTKIADIVAAGDRLEHFHSYDLPTRAQTTEQTIDFHVDQGVFIAFTPALVYVSDTDSSEKDAAMRGTFALRRADGSEVDVVFNPDSLIILPGDSLQELMSKQQSGSPVHAPMHAFRVPEVGCEGCYRLWYGMMQLPPANARHEASGLSFGELRQTIIDATSSEDSAAAVGLGCSRRLQARELQASCSSTQIYCWHRCFDFTETISPDACAEEGLGFNCTSQWDEIWLPEHGHGDFNPACTNSTSLVTPLPVVPQPTETDQCTGFMDIVADEDYAYRTELIENVTYLLWNVIGDAVEVKMVHNGRAGWLAVGINMGGDRGGMYGAHIVMGQYNPDSMEPFTVEEYRIHDSLAAYRHWKTPYSPTALSDTMMSVTDCFSIMTFKTSSIYGEALNVTSGTNKLIWGLTQDAYVTDEANGFAAYHGFGRRGHLNLEFIPGMSTTVSQDSEMAGANFVSPISAALGLACLAALLL
mmetsp:Transcript_47466/g.87225  ORF Transcript_47466/g.87225 Transcript_47466/m.87225 type:complete len:640 (+) Transcript_47466:99-2018(+)